MHRSLVILTICIKYESLSPEKESLVVEKQKNASHNEFLSDINLFTSRDEE